MNAITPSRFGRFFLVAVFASICGIAALSLTSPVDAFGNGNSGCEGDAKIDGGGPVTYTAPAGKSIDYVCIKAGRDVFTYYCGETDKTGCYTVEWTIDEFGCCSSVTISGGGTGRDCKAISHTAVAFADGECDDKK